MGISAIDQRSAMNGLHILPRGGFRSLNIAAAAGLLFGAYMAIASAVVFRGAVSVIELNAIAQYSAFARVLHSVPGCVTDELLYRLLAMTGLVWLLTRAAGNQVWCYWLAIAVVALIIYPAWHLDYLRTLTPCTMTALREILLRGAAGLLWGYIYWRYGLVASIIGHFSAHVSLEPMMGAFF